MHNFPQTRAEFDCELFQRINTSFSSGVDLSLASQAQFYFDALWAGVLGLNKTLRNLFLSYYWFLLIFVRFSIEVYSLSDFSYDLELNSSMPFTNYLQDSIRALNFSGVSVSWMSIMLNIFSLDTSRLCMLELCSHFRLCIIIISMLCFIIRVMYNLMVMVIAYHSLGSFNTKRVCFVWQMIAWLILLPTLHRSEWFWSNQGVHWH